MIFSIQRFIEDYFHQRSFSDPDQFAVSLANTYYWKRAKASRESFLSIMRRVRTVFYRTNGVDRAAFESSLLRLLDEKFDITKKPSIEGELTSELVPESRRLTNQRRITVKQLLYAYKDALESRAIDAFWQSRKQGKLRSRPEGIAQSLLAGILRFFFRHRGRGLEFREFASGVGFVDVGIVLSSVLHLVELKVLTAAFVGPAQLADYMAKEHRPEGWLVVIDTRPDNRKTTLPKRIRVKQGVIHVIQVDVNPVAPSKKKSA